MNKQEWRNRIIQTGEVAPDELLANPRNWRTHPQYQQDALTGVLDQVGWVQEVIVNQHTGHLVDGHLRVELARRRGERSIPVKYVDLSEEEEALVLATLDPIASLANADAQRLDELLQQVEATDTTLQELLSDLSAQANALLASDNAQDLADGAVEAVKKAKGDKRTTRVDLIFTLGAGGQAYTETRNGTSAQILCCLACKSGWLYGLRSSAGACAVSGIMASHKVQFVDCLYTDYNHDLHLAQVARHRPRYATVRDIMSKDQCKKAGIEYYPFDQIMRWAEELKPYADNVIVIPKIDCVDDIPSEFMLGYSIPTSHGGSPLPIAKYKGRRVHLLGGSPNKQIAYWSQLPDEVVSLDNNYIMKAAGFGQAWFPDGTTKSLQDIGIGIITNPLYIALAISLGNFAAYFNKHGEDQDRISPAEVWTDALDEERGCLMCSIFGAIGRPDGEVIAALHLAAGDRGRDGGRIEWYNTDDTDDGVQAVLGNWRAVPTTEVQKGPLQPYNRLVHNGTIANDKALGAKEGEIDSMVLPRILDRDSVQTMAHSLSTVRGSYAIAAFNGHSIILACNYKPIYYYSPDGETVYFSSMARHFEKAGMLLRGLLRGQAPVKMAPYSVLDLRTWESVDLPRTYERRALVIASAGLDSTTVAAKLVADGYLVRLLHFRYGCIAEGPEASRIPAIAEALGCEYRILPLDYGALREQGSSIPLLDRESYASGESTVRGGVEGAEYAYEWVPARNLLMLAMATAYAETNGFHVIALGNNLEEAGAYPDNEEEFTTLFSHLLPYAVHDGYKVEVVSPVGNLMKHEIVRLGLDLGAPYELTWSCYRDGAEHCGECGPCFMRKTAFERNGEEDPVFLKTSG